MVVLPAQGNWTGYVVNGLVYHFQKSSWVKGNEGDLGWSLGSTRIPPGLLVIANQRQRWLIWAHFFIIRSCERICIGRARARRRLVRSVERSAVEALGFDRWWMFLGDGLMAACCHPCGSCGECRYVFDRMVTRDRPDRISSSHMKFIGIPIQWCDIWGVNSGKELVFEYRRLCIMFDLISRQGAIMPSPLALFTRSPREGSTLKHHFLPIFEAPW